MTLMSFGISTHSRCGRSGPRSRSPKRRGPPRSSRRGPPPWPGGPSRRGRNSPRPWPPPGAPPKPPPSRRGGGPPRRSPLRRSGPPSRRGPRSSRSSYLLRLLGALMPATQAGIMRKSERSTIPAGFGVGVSGVASGSVMTRKSECAVWRNFGIVATFVRKPEGWHFWHLKSQIGKQVPWAGFPQGQRPQIMSISTRISRGLAPSPGPMMPRSSRMSIIRAARP